MKIHEFQAKSILANYGVPVPQGEVVETSADAAQAAAKLGGGVTVVKAQIHAGGRGKGGGVKVVKSADEARQMAEQILGMTLVTYQTGPRGQRVRAGPRRAGARDQARVVSRHRARSLDGKARPDGQPGGRRRDREGRRGDARPHLPRIHRSGGGTRRLPDAQARLRARPRRAADRPGVEVHVGGLGRVSRHRRLAHRDRPADRHRRRRAARARRQDDIRRQRPVPARRDQGDARSRAKRIRSKSRRRSTR